MVGRDFPHPTKWLAEGYPRRTKEHGTGGWMQRGSPQARMQLMAESLSQPDMHVIEELARANHAQ